MTERAAAQPPSEPDPSVLDPDKRERASLKQRTGVARGKELLGGADWRQRLRGIERLGRDGSDEAIEALVDAMQEGSAVRSNADTRLEAVRALAPFASKEAVRRVLVGVMMDVDPDVPDAPLDSLARSTAAMALARVDDVTTTVPLVTAIIGRGSSGSLASQALLAHPPSSLEPLVRGFKRRMSPAVVELLGKLRDPRAIGVLRRLLEGKPEALHAPTALALARLGDARAAEWARRALGKKKDAAARLAATEILLELDTADAPAALATLLGDARTRPRALALAARGLSPALVPTLEAVVRAPVTQSERTASVAILGRIGTDRAAAVLVELLAEPELATGAALGLARMAHPSARAELARALTAAKIGAPRRLIVRAALVRSVIHGERIAGIEDTLAAMLADSDAADRAVGVFGSALLGLSSPGELLDRSRDRSEMVAALARALVALGPEALGVLASRVTAESDGARATAAWVAMLSSDGALSAADLATVAERGGAEAPLAAYRLAARGSEAQRKRVVRLLAGTDPIVRRHVALGLGLSPDASAASLLVGAYRFEVDPRVRRAIVRGLSQRKEARRIPTLRLAQGLDPDDEVRALARTALTGRRLGVPDAPWGAHVIWVSLRANHEDNEHAVRSRAMVLDSDDALALPVVGDPDGVLLVPGVSDTASFELRLAPATATDQP